jgi:hypothetical protein
MLVAAMLLVACNPTDEPTGPAAGPTHMQLDVSAQSDEFQPVVPATVELPQPVVCGPFTVYDQEDVETLCSPTTLAATPITSPTCPQAVSGSVRLEVDLICPDRPGLTGLIVVSDNTVIDLNGRRIECFGEPVGYQGSCQRFDGLDNDRGINTNGFDNVHIFSHLPGGTIQGWDIGIEIRPTSDNIKVKQVTVTGPPAAGGGRPHNAIGIFIDGVDCENGHVRIGGGTNTGNTVSHHTRGIEVFRSACVYVGYNQVHDNGGSGRTSGNIGILLASSPSNHIRSNVVMRNGDGDENLDAGLRISEAPATGNLVVENQVNKNNPYGVRTRNGAADNYIVNNQMLFNTQVDAHSDQTSVGLNDWNENNRCITQTTPDPPPGVCSPDDVPPPQ